MKTLLLSFALVSAFSCFGQQSHNIIERFKGQEPFDISRSGAYDRYIDGLIKNNSCPPKLANKNTSATASRMVAHAIYSWDGTAYAGGDSSSYIYSGARGGDPETEIKSDHSYFFYSGSAVRNVNTYNASDDIISTTYQFGYGTAGWSDNGKSFRAFDGAGNLLVDIYKLWDSASGSWQNQNMTVYSYTAANKVSETNYHVWNSGTSSWDSSFRIARTYDAGGREIYWVSQTWNTSTSSWDSAYRVYKTYNTAGELLTGMIQYWDISALVWTNGGRHTYTYDVSGNETEDLWENWNFATGDWQNGNKTMFSSFAAGKPQIAIIQNWDEFTANFENSMKDSCSYNSYHQLTYRSKEQWDGTAWQKFVSTASAERYYYEEYWRAGISAQPANTTELIIYPVPATDEIKVTNNGTSPISVSITDISGHSVATSLQLKAKATSTVDVSFLTPGFYYATAATKCGQVTKTISIIR